MPQTRNGAGENPWIQYMKACAANYRAGHTQHHSVEGRPAEDETSERPTVKKRITKKQPDPNAVDVEVKPTTGKTKTRSQTAPKPITGQDMTKVIKAKPKPKAAPKPITGQDMTKAVRKTK
jgi:hypothetical protein